MKQAVVIGCGNIGFASIQKLVSLSYEVYAFDLKYPDYLKEYCSKNETVHFANIVANDEASVADAFSGALDNNNQVDYVVSTVGISTSATPLNNPDGFDKVVDVNVFGNVIPIKYLVNNGYVGTGARIAVIVSTSGHLAGKELIAYSTSKWILNNACICLQKELADKGIALDIINPRTITNRYSDSFKGSAGIQIEDVIDKIFTVKPQRGGANLYVPTHYGCFHFIERCIPWLFDLAFKLKPHCVRKPKYARSYNSVLITGASSGLGKALAYKFAPICKTLVVAARNISALDELKSAIESKTDCTVFPICADLSGINGCDVIVRSLGEGVDLIINNAGTQYAGNICDLEMSRYRISIQTNCLSPIRLTGMCLNMPRKPKTIVNILSTTAITGRKGLGAYSSSKAGLWSFTKALRRTFGSEINVIEVIPATFKSSLGRNNASTDNESSTAKKAFSSSKMGMTSESVAEIIYNGIRKRKDRILIPATKARLFIWFEAMFPSLFKKVFV